MPSSGRQVALEVWVGPPGISSFALVVIALSEPQYARELGLRAND